MSGFFKRKKKTPTNLVIIPGQLTISYVGYHVDETLKVCLGGSVVRTMG